MTLLRAVIFLSFWAFPGIADPLSPGRAVFEGLAEAPGYAAIGSNKVEASRFPCRTCHRRDGRGGGEGDAPPIAWEYLSRPAHGRPAYDVESFSNLLATGVAPSGKRISRLMPRYEFDDETMGSLVAYLSMLTAEQKTGIHPDRIVFGVPVPTGREAYGRRLIQNLDALIAAKIPRNGLYGRRVELRPLVGDLPSIVGQARRQTVAVLSPVPSGRRGYSHFTDSGIPVLFPLAAVSEGDDHTLIRSLYASRERVIRSLIDKIGTDGCRQISLLTATESEFRDVQERLVQKNLAPLEVSRGLEGHAECVFFLSGNPGTLTWQDMGRPRAIYVPGVYVVDLLNSLEGFDGTLVVGRHETAAIDLAVAEDIEVIRAHAVLIGEVLRDALRIAGRDLTRTNLLSAVGAVSRPDLGIGFPTGRPAGSEEVTLQSVRFESRNVQPE